jgi:hypothetical protein
LISPEDISENFGESCHCKNLNFENFGESQYVAKDYPRNIQNIHAKLNTKWFSGFREEYFKIFSNNL